MRRRVELGQESLRLLPAVCLLSPRRVRVWPGARSRETCARGFLEKLTVSSWNSGPWGNVETGTVLGLRISASPILDGGTQDHMVRRNHDLCVLLVFLDLTGKEELWRPHGSRQWTAG